MKIRRWITVLFLLAGALSIHASGQVNTYASNQPSLTPFKTLYGAEIEVALRNADPGALIFWTASLLEEHEPPFYMQRSLDPKSFDSARPVYEGIADAQGRHLLRIPALDKPGFVNRVVRLDVLVKNPRVLDEEHLIAICFEVLNPALCFSTVLSDTAGAISKFDELEGRIINRIEPIHGRPGKIVFSPDFRMGYVMLDQDRIAAFDNLYNHVIYVRQAGLGLADIGVTPDGKKLIALTLGVHNPSSPVPPMSSLWIYDARDLSQQPEKVDIDPVSPGSMGDLFAVSEDSTLVYVRQAGMFVGEFNLFTHRFHRFQVGDKNHFHGEVRDIELFRNCPNGMGHFLLVLVEDPHGNACLHVVNTQIYTDRCYPLGNDPRGMKRYQADGRDPRVVVLDGGDEEKDILWLLDLLGEEETELLALPDGAGDFAVSHAGDLCMILYPEPGQGTGQVRFYDLKSRKLLHQSIPVNLEGGGRVYLSRADMNTGYVYSSSGEVTVIDLEALRISGVFHLNGYCREPAVEIY